MMMTRHIPCIIVVWVMLSIHDMACAFTIPTGKNVRMVRKIVVKTTETSMMRYDDVIGGRRHISMDGLHNIDHPNEPIDYERIKYCTDHFGVCSIPEMEHMKHELHQERLQNLLFGGSYGFVPDIDGTTFANRLLEEELDTQLLLLKDHQGHHPSTTTVMKTEATTDVSFIPNDVVEDTVLPHLHDTSNHMMERSTTLNHNEQQPTTNGLFHTPTPSEILMLEETVLEENLLEPIAICLVIVGLALMPQLM